MAKKEKNKKGNKAKKGNNANSGGSSDSVIVRRLDGSLDLAKLQHVIMKKKGKGGKKIECLVLPIDKNYMIRGKDGGVYLNVKVNLKDKEDDFNQHGFISHQVPSAIWKEASEEEQAEMKKTPILGGIKDWDFNGGSSSSNSNTSHDDIGEEDDLPF